MGGETWWVYGEGGRGGHELNIFHRVGPTATTCGHSGN